jgi:uncharacterized lipoprotein YbaY
MKKHRTLSLLILALLAAVVLSACDALGGGATLTGTVNKLDRMALPDNATVEVDLLRQATDGTPDTVVSSTSFPTEGNQVPLPFELVYNPADIDPAAVYFVGARVLSDGQLLYVNAGPVPVLTQGAATENVEIMLTPAVDTGAAPADGATAPEGGENVPPPAELGTVLTGSATSATAFAFPADSAAYLQVEIREPMLADAPAVATTQIPVAGLAFPIAFELPYDSAAIDPTRSYVVDGRIIDNNQLLFSGQGGVPVLTNGAPAADVQLPLYAGVSTGPEPIEPGDTTAPVANAITGQATSALPYTFGADSQAYLQVELREPMLADAPAAAFTRIPMAGMTFPIPFELAYDPAAVDMTKAYVLDGRVVDGNTLLFTAQGGVPVLTNGAPSAGVDLPLFVSPEAGPAPLPEGGFGGGALLTGTIVTDAPAALDPNAVLVIDLREAGTTGQPMVSISQMLAGAQFPLRFEVPYAPGQIDQARDYVIGARILLGDQVLYASPAGVPVLTKGAPSTDVAVNIPPQ